MTELGPKVEDTRGPRYMTLNVSPESYEQVSELAEQLSRIESAKISLGETVAKAAQLHLETLRSPREQFDKEVIAALQKYASANNDKLEEARFITVTDSGHVYETTVEEVTEHD